MKIDTSYWQEVLAKDPETGIGFLRDEIKSAREKHYLLIIEGLEDESHLDILRGYLKKAGSDSPVFVQGYGVDSILN